VVWCVCTGFVPGVWHPSGATLHLQALLSPTWLLVQAEGMGDPTVHTQRAGCWLQLCLLPAHSMLPLSLSGASG
jgi:hypothetical protein